MFRKLSVAALFLLLMGTSEAVQAGEHGQWAWLKSNYHAYHDPANYPGRTVYPGSRYGFYGYVRPEPSIEPVPRSMKKTAPPTMYHWSKSMRKAGGHGGMHGGYGQPHVMPEPAVYDYWE